MAKKALISVSDKEGIEEFAKQLVEMGYEITSSGGTALVLKAAGIKVQEVAELSGYGSILNGRVKTLTPPVHGGLLATPQDIDELNQLGFPWFDLVCVDLYPLKQEIAKPGATRESVIEQTDIGGVALIRSGAKGRRIVISDPEDREVVLGWLIANKPDEDEYITDLASKGEAVAADYALASARFQSRGKYDGFVLRRSRKCDYGENRYQTPADLMSNWEVDDPLALENFDLVEGEKPSYNNWTDVDRLLQTITHIAAGFDLNYGKVPLIAVAVKHGNPCGAAYGEDATRVLEKVILGDPLAIMGGLVITNFPIDGDKAHLLRTRFMPNPEKEKRLLDGIMAPSFTEEAKAELNRKGGKCRLLANDALLNLSAESLDPAMLFRQVRGGFLRQPNYTYILDLNDPKLVKIGQLDEAGEKDMLLASGVGLTSNSNTITLVNHRMLIGNGVGQQDRVGGCNLAIYRAERSHHVVRDSIAYSDSFFPFADGPQVLIDKGVKAIFASSGARRDEEIIQLCKDNGIVLYMMPDAECRGFFNH